jgi:hypothetical protein
LGSNSISNSAEIFMRKKPGSGKERREGLTLIEWKEGEPYVVHAFFPLAISDDWI